MALAGDVRGGRRRHLHSTILDVAGRPSSVNSTKSTLEGRSRDHDVYW
jgi:hypothetical protein